MHARRPGIPKTARVFSEFVIRLPARTNQRFVANQIADTTSLRILAAGSIVTASQLDCFPARQASQQFARQSRLAGVGRQAADGNDDSLGGSLALSELRRHVSMFTTETQRFHRAAQR